MTSPDFFSPVNHGDAVGGLLQLYYRNASEKVSLQMCHDHFANFTTALAL